MYDNKTDINLSALRNFKRAIKVTWAVLSIIALILILIGILIRAPAGHIIFVATFILVTGLLATALFWMERKNIRDGGGE